MRLRGNAEFIAPSNASYSYLDRSRIIYLLANNMVSGQAVEGYRGAATLPLNPIWGVVAIIGGCCSKQGGVLSVKA